MRYRMAVGGSYLGGARPELGLTDATSNRGTLTIFDWAAASAGDPAPGVTALNATNVSRLITMATQACLIDSRRGQFRRVDDVVGGH